MSGPADSFSDYSESEGGGLPAFIRDPMGILRRGWKWGLAGFVPLAVVAVFLAEAVPLKYQATARLLMSSKSIPDEFVPTTIIAGASEHFQTIQGEILTRERLRKVVESTPSYAPLRERELMSTLVADLRDSLTIESVPLRGERGEVRSLDIRVGLVGRDPQRIAETVNRITTELINQSNTFRTEQSRVTLDFMQREFEQADQALREHQRQLAAFRERYRGSLPEEQPATIAKLERLESQRRSIILQINDARSQLQAEATGFALPGVPMSERDQKVAELTRLLAIYTDDHPQVQSLRRQIAALDGSEEDEESGADGSGTSLRSRLLSQIAAREERLAEIDEEVEQLEGQVARTSEITEEYQALQRKEVILQEAYTSYLRKLKNAELARSMELAQKGAQLALIESAHVPTRPVIPRIAFVGVGIVLALGLSLGLVLLHELLNPVVIDAAHVEQLTSLPTLGSLPPIC
jgi:uncharacterized protein involved in exopolysaccharide biosynthesis